MENKFSRVFVEPDKDVVAVEAEAVQVKENKKQEDGKGVDVPAKVTANTNLFDPAAFDPYAKDPESGILLRHLDPRPDIKADRLDWVDILQNCLVWDGFAEGRGEHLWGVLHGLRCGGARIQRVRDSGGGMGYKLLPGEWKEEDWQQARKDYLDPIREDLIALFKFTKEHGKLARMEEIWPEGDKPGEANQTKLF